jgi:hypothetical protein
MRYQVYVRFLSTLAILAMVIANSQCLASDIFVDNQRGNDSWNGDSRLPGGFRLGPVKTIRRAMQLAGPGDSVQLTNTGVPYFESIELNGFRHSGYAGLEFEIIGNGAVVDGSLPVPKWAWGNRGTDLWAFKPWNKGHVFLLHNWQVVPEFRTAGGEVSPADVPGEQWYADGGIVYFKSAPQQIFRPEGFRFAHHGVGLTLYEVHDVAIRNVTFRHFRIDGVNAHDRCQNILLDNVTVTGNGRSGLAVGGDSNVEFRGGRAVDNRLHQVLITELGAVNIDNAELSAPPTVAE